MTNLKNKRETAAIRCESITTSDLNEKQGAALANVLHYLGNDYDGEFSKVVDMVMTRTTLPYEHKEYVTVALWMYKQTIVVNDRHHRFTFCIGKRGGLFIKDAGFKTKRLTASGVRKFAEVA